MKKYLGCLVFLLSFTLYLSTMVPSVTEDDSGELAGVGSTLGIAHSPGYPLYAMMGKITATLVPWANEAYRVNLLSALTVAGAACAVFFLLTFLVENVLAAAALSLVFACSPLVWAMAMTTEVYGIAALAVALMALVVVRSRKRTESGPVSFYAVLFLFGLGVSAHYTVGLLLPGILWWTWENREELLGDKKALRLLAGAGWAAAGFSVVLFIYLRARNMPVFGWEDPKTLGRFWQVIARLRYGTANLAQGGAPPFTPDMLAKKIIFFGQVLKENITVPGILLLAAGMVKMLKDRKLGWVLLLFLAGGGPLFLILANVGLDPVSIPLLKRFFFLSLIFVSVGVAYGVTFIPVRFQAAVVVLPVFLAVTTLPGISGRNEFLYYDYARNILKSVPHNAVLLSDRADEMEFCVAWLQRVRHYRDDVEFIDCNAGITRSIYGDDYYRIWGKPRLAIREKTERDLIAGSSRPVYYATFYPDMIPLRRIRQGLVMATDPAQSQKPVVPFDELFALRDADVPPGSRGYSLLTSHYQLLGDYFLDRGDPARADHCFGQVAARDDRGSWAASIGYAYHQKGCPELARKYYELSAKQGWSDSTLFANLGALSEAAGRRDEAAAYYDRALRVDPRNEQAHFNRAVLYWKESRWEQVADEFRQVLAINPSNQKARGFLQMAEQRLKH